MMECPKLIFYTKAQLEKLHKELTHPVAYLLYKHIRNAGMKVVSGDTLRTLQEVVDRCEKCQRTQRVPTRLSAPGSEDARFNQHIYMFIMYIEPLPMLHKF